MSGLIFFVNGNEKSPELLECRVEACRLILSVDHTIIFARQSVILLKYFRENVRYFREMSARNLSRHLRFRPLFPSHRMNRNPKKIVVFVAKYARQGLPD